MAEFVTVAGARRLARTLRAAGHDMAELKAVNKETADVVARAARVTVPHRSGRLAQSIRTSGTQVQGIVRAGRKAIPYAGVINYGWAARNIEPTYFATDAAKDTEPEWFRLYTERTEELLGRVEGI